MGYLKNNTAFYDASKNIIGYGDKYQLVEVMQEYDSYCLVNMDGKIGIISKKDIKEIKGSFVAVDISTQRIYYYCNTDVAFRDRCTTGKKTTPTELGFFEPYGKASSHDFGPKHNNVKAKILWMPYNGDQGLHDADWEDDSNFGDYNYAMKHGSGGCVRLPDSAAHFVYDNVPKSTKILVKQ